MRELSKRNKYYISKERFLELKHFCMQYKEWKKACRELDDAGINSRYILTPNKALYNPVTGSDVEKIAMSKMYYSNKIEIVQTAAELADEDLYWWLLKGITEGYGYTYLHMTLKMPCSKNMYYDKYRKFFYILDKLQAKNTMAVMA